MTKWFLRLILVNTLKDIPQMKMKANAGDRFFKDFDTN